MLDDRHDLNLSEIMEELIEFLLVRAIQNQVASEYENAGRQYGQNFKSLEANDSIPEQVDLIDIEGTYESEVDPRERSFERQYSKLVHVEANLRLIHL